MIVETVTAHEISSELWYPEEVTPRLWAAVVVVAVATLAPSAQSALQTTTPTVYVAIHVTLTGSKVVVEPRSAPRGVSARFILHNIGTKAVIFSVGNQTRGLGALFGFRTVVKPRTQKTLLLYLAARGTIRYYSGSSFADATAGEKGVLVVGATCALCAPPGPPVPP